jgi:hypothetical protein
MWTLARFEYASTKEVELDAGAQFIREQLEGRERLNSTELRNAAKGRVSGPAVNSGLSHLEMRGLIDYIEGPNNSKLWGWKEAGEPVRDSRQADRLPEMPVRQPDSLSDNPNTGHLSLSVPVGDRLMAGGVSERDRLEEPEAA